LFNQLLMNFKHYERSFNTFVFLNSLSNKKLINTWIFFSFMNTEIFFETFKTFLSTLMQDSLKERSLSLKRSSFLNFP
jgi:hypothetical protein